MFEAFFFNLILTILSITEIVHEWLRWSIARMILIRQNGSTLRKPVLVPICPLRLHRDWCRAKIRPLQREAGS